MEYKTRSFRIDDEVWLAVCQHELSANQLLRAALGLSSKAATGSRPAISAASAEALRATAIDYERNRQARGMRPKGDNKR